VRTPQSEGGAGEGVSEPGETAALAAKEGFDRLDRSWPSLLATGAVGGVDVSIGVIALVLITERTGNEVVASLGFAIGFVALSLAGSELITENFLVPVVTVARGGRPVRSLLRLWGGTLVANLVGGAVVMVVFAIGWQGEIGAAIPIGGRGIDDGIGLASFAQAMVAGLLITLMTWMQQGVKQSVGGRLVAAYVIGFLIIYTHSNHVVVGAFEVTLGILAGATAYGWADLAVAVPWWFLGNLVGGLAFVTIVRLVQANAQD
jgi:formate/nitrite transporter FocA (FNT family)